MTHDWRDCDFAMVRDGDEVRVIRYRPVACTGPHTTLYEFTIVTADGLAILARYEMRRIDK